MLNLAVLLQIVGVVLTFTIGVPGYVFGPAVIVAGGLLYRQEKKRLANAGPDDENAAPDSRRGRKIAAGIVAAVAAISAILGITFYLTSGLTDSAENFLRALRDDDMPVALSYLAADFRAATSVEELQGFVSNSALRDYESASWSSRSVVNTRGSLEGVINTGSGGAVPLSMSLIKEGGTWKIYSLSKPQAGLLSEEQAALPTAAEQQRLVRGATGIFIESVVAKDFSAMYDGIAGAWKRETSADDLATIFVSFTEVDANWSALNEVMPTISSANIGENDELILAGVYPTTPVQMKFEQTFLREGLDWRLIGFAMQTE